jgi:protein involved in polysaccharide export with SLBB domain
VAYKSEAVTALTEHHSERFASLHCSRWQLLVSEAVICRIVTLLIFLLTFENFGQAQSTLQTPMGDEPQQLCLNAKCTGDSRTSESQATPQTNVQSQYPTQFPIVPDRFPERIAAGVQDRKGVPEPSPRPTEFQEFVTTSVGRKLPIYGYSLFDRVPTTFAPVDRIPVTADYVIGPGDELLVRAWGQIDLDAKLIVDRGGEVYLPKVGALTVAGLKYDQLQAYCKTAVGRVFRNFDLNISLGQLRSIQVFVVGQARRPGNYTISSLSTLVNTLFASSGPSATGSMRHILLKRDNRVIPEFDFYDLLMKGDKSRDVRLLPGDVIYIPAVGPSIAVAGSVKVPAIYEMRDRASLREAIGMAGGLATTADKQRVVIERIEDRTTRKVEEFPLDENGLDRELKDGDVVRVFSLSPRFENAVTLRGNVARPGRYEWRPGLRIKDLIPNQDALVTRAYWLSNNSVSTPSENSERSKSLSRSSEDLESSSQNRAGLDGEQTESLSRPGENSESSSRKAEKPESLFRNEVKRDVPEINWDYAVIQRLDTLDLTTRLIPFNLGKVVLKGDEQDNLALEPSDIITVFSQADLEVPLERRSKFVRLEGEFKASGVYKVEPGETLRHLVARVNGLTSKAYLYGSEFTREAVRAQQQKGLDQLADSLEHDVDRGAISPTINPDEAAAKRTRVEAQRQLVDKLRQVKATGRVVLELKPDAVGVDALPNMTLEDGDRFMVPHRPSTVDVLGAIYNNNSFLYRMDKSVGAYLKEAGGTTRQADTGRILIIRADGTVLSKQSTGGLWNGGFESRRLMPGDAIVVPERLSQGTTLKALKDWSQVISQFALGAVAVKVLSP